MPNFCSMTEEEKALIWRYRYSLSGEKDKLVKFLFSVNWQKTSEASAAILMKKEWANIEMVEALPLLSGFFSLNNVYTDMRVTNPINKDIISYFKKIRNHGVQCFKNSVS